MANHKLIYFGVPGYFKLKTWQRITLYVVGIVCAFSADSWWTNKLNRRFSGMVGKTNLYGDETVNFGWVDPSKKPLA